MDNRDPGERITKSLQVGDAVWRAVAADLDEKPMQKLTLTVDRGGGVLVDYEVTVRRLVR